MRVRGEFEAEERPAPAIAMVARILGVPRSTIYYRPQRKSSPRVDEVMARRVKGVVERYSRYGYRRVRAVLYNRDSLVVNRKKVQRIMRIKGWQVRRRPSGHRPRAKGRPSVVPHSNAMGY